MFKRAKNWRDAAAAASARAAPQFLELGATASLKERERQLDLPTTKYIATCLEETFKNLPSVSLLAHSFPLYSSIPLAKQVFNYDYGSYYAQRCHPRS